MAVNEFMTGRQDVIALEKDLGGMHEVYREIANEIGVENTVVIYNLFRGTQVSFPNRLFSREYIHQAIAREYDGTNVHQLAQKYNYSTRTVWRILKKEKRK